ncbi:polygalacturonase inhibitor 2-like, partial [Trifolium medium]|nr:polygalacturonase inhibitor 2-like [Trifolium medium]
TLQVTLTPHFHPKPSTLAEIKTLSGIALTDNKLTGHLPITLSPLPKLKGIGFDGNQLTGEIPKSYGLFSTLFKVLTLSRNRISGKIPKSLV